MCKHTFSRRYVTLTTWCYKLSNHKKNILLKPRLQRLTNHWHSHSLGNTHCHLQFSKLRYIQIGDIGCTKHSAALLDGWRWSWLILYARWTESAWGHVSRNQISHTFVKHHRKKSLTYFFGFSCSASALKPQTLCHPTTFWNQRLSWVNWGTDPCQTWNLNLIPDLIVSPSSTWFHSDSLPLMLIQSLRPFRSLFLSTYKLFNKYHKQTVASVTQRFFQIYSIHFFFKKWLLYIYWGEDGSSFLGLGNMDSTQHTYTFSISF